MGHRLGLRPLLVRVRPRSAVESDMAECYRRRPNTARVVLQVFKAPRGARNDRTASARAWRAGQSPATAAPLFAAAGISSTIFQPQRDDSLSINRRPVNYGWHAAFDGAGIRNANGTLFQVGQPLPPNQLSGVSVSPPNEVASPTQRAPYGRQASGGVSHELRPWLAVGFDVSTVAYRDVPFRFRANPNTGPGQPRRFPQFGNFRLWYGKGFADYKGANFNVRARLTTRATLQGLLYCRRPPVTCWQGRTSSD
jgi:hypothetical protein